VLFDEGIDEVAAKICIDRLEAITMRLFIGVLEALDPVSVRILYVMGYFMSDYRKQNEIPIGALMRTDGRMVGVRLVLIHPDLMKSPHILGPKIDFDGIGSSFGTSILGTLDLENLDCTVEIVLGKVELILLFLEELEAATYHLLDLFLFFPRDGIGFGLQL